MSEHFFLHSKFTFCTRNIIFDAQKLRAALNLHLRNSNSKTALEKISKSEDRSFCYNVCVRALYSFPMNHKCQFRITRTYLFCVQLVADR